MPDSSSIEAYDFITTTGALLAETSVDPATVLGQCAALQSRADLVFYARDGAHWATCRWVGSKCPA